MSQIDLCPVLSFPESGGFASVDRCKTNKFAVGGELTDLRGNCGLRRQPAPEHLLQQCAAGCGW
jgi:hypothetical protein